MITCSKRSTPNRKGSDGKFAWRARETEHFGQQWYPFAEVRLLTARQRWRPFAFQIDTGAMITVLRRSAAEHLGLPLASGMPIELGGVGGPLRRYFVHPLQARIGELGPFELRVAIAESESVPNLLGRLDFFDRFRVEHDPILHRTSIVLP